MLKFILKQESLALLKATDTKDLVVCKEGEDRGASVSGWFEVLYIKARKHFLCQDLFSNNIQILERIPSFKTEIMSSQSEGFVLCFHTFDSQATPEAYV